MSTPEPKLPSLVSIERVVTFVVGPIVIAGSGMLSAFLATKVGVTVTPKVIEGAVATGGLAAGAGIYAWLKGRSAHTLELLRADLEKVQPILGSVGISPGIESGFIHTTLADLEGLAQHAAAKAVAAIHGATPIKVEPGEANKGVAPGQVVNNTPGPVPSNTPPAEQPPPPEPIVAAANDPAPATPVQAVGPVADAGAAPTQ